MPDTAFVDHCWEAGLDPFDSIETNMKREDALTKLAGSIALTLTKLAWRCARDERYKDLASMYRMTENEARERWPHATPEWETLGDELQKVRELFPHVALPDALLLWAPDNDLRFNGWVSVWDMETVSSAQHVIFTWRDAAENTYGLGYLPRTVGG